jgi:MFS transporter, Spinster family, sphingosine-1-phosphate transporter
VIKRPAAILTLLTALNLLNYLDRFLVMAVSPKIRESLSLSGVQTGWVTTAFMFGYFLTSPLFGWLGDRYPRKHLIMAGVAVWSAATVLSGHAESFGELIAWRVLVGVGEASYATLGPTIIDDVSTPENRSRSLSIFYVAIPVGSALGFIAGGYLQERFDWRWAFYIAGGPGLLLALIVLLIREPSRSASPSARTEGSYTELARSRAYVFTVAGYVAQTFALGGFTAWAASFLYYVHGLDLQTADASFGYITVATGLAGTALGGFLADRWPSVDRTLVYLRVCAWSSIVAAPLTLAALLMHSSTGFLVLLGVSELAIFVSVSPVNAAVLHSVRPGLRATAMATSIFFIHLLGDLISPPILGKISDAFADPHEAGKGAPGLQAGMYLLPLALAISGAAWLAGSRGRAVTPGGTPAVTPRDTA